MPGVPSPAVSNAEHIRAHITYGLGFGIHASACKNHAAVTDTVHTRRRGASIIVSES